MSTVSSQCIDAVVALLNDASGRPAELQTVVRTTLREPPASDAVPTKKFIFVRTGKNDLEPIGSLDGPLRQNRLTCEINAVAFGDASTPPDVAVDALVAWCTKKLDGARLGVLAEQVTEVKREPVYRQGEYPGCRMTLTYLIDHTSRTGDAEQRH